MVEGAGKEEGSADGAAGIMDMGAEVEGGTRMMMMCIDREMGMVWCLTTRTEGRAGGNEVQVPGDGRKVEREKGMGIEIGIEEIVIGRGIGTATKVGTGRGSGTGIAMIGTEKGIGNGIEIGGDISG